MPIRQTYGGGMAQPMDVLTYFRENPNNIIKHCTDPHISKYTQFIPKVLAREIYKQYGERRLNSADVHPFMDLAEKKLRDYFSETLWDHEQYHLFYKILNKTTNYVSLVIDEKRGIVPECNPETDLNLVSAARNFPTIFPEISLNFDRVIVFTRDFDVDIGVGLCNRYHKPNGIELTCNMW